MDEASPSALVSGSGRASGPGRRSLPVLPSGASDAGAVHVARALADAGVDDLREGAARVAMVTLGCDKNTVDSERILSQLLGAGVRIVDSPEDADVVVVNTCGFIEMAKQESVDTLLEAARLKESGRVKAVVGMGCLVQRYKPELEAEMPDVDVFLGLAEADRLVPALAERGLVDPDTPLMERPLRVLSSATGTGHSSHLKISEGCDHGCAFCAIPLMRGKFRSTPIDVLVGEARELERRGVVELNIVSQDTTWYGRDWARALGRGEEAPVWSAEGESWFLGRPFDGMPNAPAPTPGNGTRVPAAAPDTGGAGGMATRGPGLEALRHRDGEGPVRPGPLRIEGVERTGALPLLLRTLLAETAIPWLRLFYMYPSGITPELVRLIGEQDRILPYLDMPIQHGADPVLKRMRRPERRATILERVGWLRDAVPELALRTTVIVGFPGETEEDFEALLSLLEEVRFDHVGAFAYSEEEDTPAATMQEQVPAPVRRERLERLMDVQRGIALERNQERIGTTVTVLVDQVDEDGAVARGAWQAPEVDGVVEIEDGAGLEVGAFVAVEIRGANDLDLTARRAG